MLGGAGVQCDSPVQPAGERCRLRAAARKVHPLKAVGAYVRIGRNYQIITSVAPSIPTPYMGEHAT